MLLYDQGMVFPVVATTKTPTTNTTDSSAMVHPSQQTTATTFCSHDNESSTIEKSPYFEYELEKSPNTDGNRCSKTISSAFTSIRQYT
jgi:hypothetical protein